MLSTQESRPRRKRCGRRRSSPADFTGSLTDAVPVGHAGPLHAEFPPVNWARAGAFPAAGRLRDAPVDRGFPQDQSEDPVIGLAGDLLQLRENPGPAPLAAAPADVVAPQEQSAIDSDERPNRSTWISFSKMTRSAILRRWQGWLATVQTKGQRPPPAACSAGTGPPRTPDTGPPARRPAGNGPGQTPTRNAQDTGSCSFQHHPSA
jgi:hypothetical protein